MAEAYRGYVHSWSAAFRALFELLLAGEVPLVFHCAAGKDRTGVAAALVLTALDVPRETVLHDYLLSRLFWREDEAAHAAFPAEAVRIAGGVDERFLAAAFEAMDSGYGGSDGYLQHALGMGPEERRVLAGLYLAPAA